MYVNTKRLFEVLDTQMPGTTLKEKSRMICKEIGLKNANVVDFYKFESGRVISLGVKASEMLFQYLTELATQGAKFQIRDIISTSNIYGTNVLRKSEALHVLYDGKKNKTEKATEVEGSEKSSREILAEVLTELKEMNKNLQHIAVSQDETCHFIRTLVYALNGEPKK